MLDEDTIKLITTALQTPPVDFHELYEGGLGKTVVVDLSETRAIENAATHLAFLGEYLDCRFSGDSHNSAVKRANSLRRKVRKAQGYTITHDINF